MKRLLVFLTLSSVVAFGCGDASVKVSKEEEEAYRHPPSLKDAPPGVLEKMNRDRANAMGNVGGGQPVQQPGGTTRGSR